MIELRPIKHPADPFFAELGALYETAFPPEERRSLKELEKVLTQQFNCVMSVVLKDLQFAGLLTYWDFGDFLYLEHFAVSESLRGQHIGSAALQEWMNATQLPLVLEVELPETELSRRRIEFYQRLGFQVLPLPYAQPYYDGSGRFLPMLLMTNQTEYVTNHFQHIKNLIYQEVYHLVPEY